MRVRVINQVRVSRAAEGAAQIMRAATNLARLWRELGRRDEARELLAPRLRLVHRGFDTADLKEAKALLDELT